MYLYRIDRTTWWIFDDCWSSLTSWRHQGHDGFSWRCCPAFRDFSRVALSWPSSYEWIRFVGCTDTRQVAFWQLFGNVVCVDWLPSPAPWWPEPNSRSSSYCKWCQVWRCSEGNGCNYWRAGWLRISPPGWLVRTSTIGGRCLLEFPHMTLEWGYLETELWTQDAKKEVWRPFSIWINFKKSIQNDPTLKFHLQPGDFGDPLGIAEKVGKWVA